MRRGGQPQTTTPVKVLGDHANRIRRLEFRRGRPRSLLGGYLFSQFVLSGSTGSDTEWTYDSGDAILGLTTPRVPEVLTAGEYLVVVAARPQAYTPDTAWRLTVDGNRAVQPSLFGSQSGPLDDPGGDNVPWITVTVGGRMEVGDTFDALITQASGSNKTFSGFITASVTT